MFASGRFYLPRDNVHFGPIPTLVGPKVVWTRPGLRAFLEAVNEVCHVCVWSSMVYSTTERIVEFLFQGLQKPSLILGQESCGILYDEDGRVVMSQTSCWKKQFFKILKSGLWDVSDRLDWNLLKLRPTPQNTLLIDDSPTKGCLNHVLAFMTTIHGVVPLEVR